MPEANTSHVVGHVVANLQTGHLMKVADFRSLPEVVFYRNWHCHRGYSLIHVMNDERAIAVFTADIDGGTSDETIIVMMDFARIEVWPMFYPNDSEIMDMYPIGPKASSIIEQVFSSLARLLTGVPNEESFRVYPNGLENVVPNLNTSTNHGNN